jgi:hypothetical protein
VFDEADTLSTVLLMMGRFFMKSLTLEREWGQQPSSPEIIASSNEISQFHKDFSGIICTVSLCSPGGRNNLTSYYSFQP